MATNLDILKSKFGQAQAAGVSDGTFRRFFSTGQEAPAQQPMQVPQPAQPAQPTQQPPMSPAEVQQTVAQGAAMANPMQVTGMHQTGLGGWRQYLMPGYGRAQSGNQDAVSSGFFTRGTGNAGGQAGAVGPYAMDYAGLIAANPGAYQSAYAPAMQATLNQLLNPEGFKYDVNADGLYQQIKDNYTKAGRQAMMDTQGQSAALTGGYGNSYAAQAGQQAYQESLGNLAAMIPELQQLAYQQYQQGMDDRRNNLEAMRKLEDQDYQRWLQDYQDYQAYLATLPMQGTGSGLNIGDIEATKDRDGRELSRWRMDEADKNYKGELAKQQAAKAEAMAADGVDTITGAAAPGSKYVYDGTLWNPKW